ncbi:MAG: hypothetical protein ACRENM_05430 [Candidatus Dormibacteraceae bacterium]
MDEYQKEIADLRAQIDELLLAEGDKDQIRELMMQAQLLDALYARALELLAVGAKAPELRQRLMTRGYGEWILDNVYAFIYEAAVEIPGEHHSFLSAIEGTDFAQLLR